MSIAYCLVACCVVYLPIGIRPENFYLWSYLFKNYFQVASDFTVNVHRNISGIFLIILKSTMKD